MPAPEVDPDLQQLNRNLMWEELVKADADRLEDAMRFHEDRLAEQRRKTAQEQMQQMKAAERRKARAKRRTVGSQRRKVDKAAAKAEAEAAAADAARREAAKALAEFRLKQDAERRAALDAEQQAKLDHERRELEEVKRAEEIVAMVENARAEKQREMGLSALKEAGRKARKQCVGVARLGVVIFISLHAPCVTPGLPCVLLLLLHRQRQRERERKRDAVREAVPDPIHRAIDTNEANHRRAIEQRAAVVVSAATPRHATPRHADFVD